MTAATIRVPDSLTELDQWVVWRYEARDGGKPTKVPYQINGSHASTKDANTWCSWDEALKAWEERPECWSGIGFVFLGGDPFFGIDLDHCLDGDGKLKPWAQPIMERFADTYAEISPSGSGIKLWAKGRLPGAGAHSSWVTAALRSMIRRDTLRSRATIGLAKCSTSRSTRPISIGCSRSRDTARRRCHLHSTRARSRRVPSMTPWSASPERCAPEDVSIPRSKLHCLRSTEAALRSQHPWRTSSGSPRAFAGMRQGISAA